MNHHSVLFQTFPLTDKLTLKNRIIMSPMTRAKARLDGVPTAEMAAYYARRADAGLIITEGTLISPDAAGYPNVAGIFTDAQVAGWRTVTDVVHQKGGHIFLQLWHVGRVSHPIFLQGQLPIAPSATQMKGPIRRSPGLFYDKSRAASLDEIETVKHYYATAAKNAMAAGFDGVEIHGANGYLIDQFLHHHTNQRDDQYGGTPQNMARFAWEVVTAVGEAIGYEHVGIRLSPGAYLNEMVGDARDAEVFRYLLQQLNALPIAYVHTGNFNDADRFPELDHMTMTAFLRAHYRGTLIASGSYQADQAAESITRKDFDLIAIGRPFIANPDFIYKLKNNLEIAQYDVSMLETLV